MDDCRGWTAHFFDGHFFIKCIIKLDIFFIGI
jgi:hypothetical protein